jgi:SAM-dependent methyltransferase
MSDAILDVPAKFRRSQSKADQAATIRSAVWLIDHMCEHVGIPDLGETELLDVGCGVKFTQALIARSLPLKRYVGIDVYADMIEYLQRTVTDPRFSYVHIDAHNELYNKDGHPLEELDSLPVGGDTFDLICLFSVFTHLEPHDYVTMLRLLRGCVRPDGRLFFTLFVNELTAGGHGLADGYARWRAASGAQVAPGDEPPPFVDLAPSKPLWWAMYSRQHALELIDGTGWEVVELSDPEELVQHHIVCRPI